MFNLLKKYVIFAQLCIGPQLIELGWGASCAGFHHKKIASQNTVLLARRMGFVVVVICFLLIFSSAFSISCPGGFTAGQNEVCYKKVKGLSQVKVVRLMSV